MAEADFTLPFSGDISYPEYEKSLKQVGTVYLDGKYKISGFEKPEALQTPVFFVERELCDITQTGMYPDFSGVINYETEFYLPEADRYFLDLGEGGETVSVYINGKYVGARICTPYRFDITEFVDGGKCILSAQVANSMACREKDILSKSMMFARYGLLGSVRVLCGKQ